mmetsp:Transcript_27011/g.40365  ORF Transcript_27011/g.40365 Transcript_27011/m.40365 type:complete len:776 (+) Transcript_27011:21-2348(+)
MATRTLITENDTKEAPLTPATMKTIASSESSSITSEEGEDDKKEAASKVLFKDDCPSTPTKTETKTKSGLFGAVGWSAAATVGTLNNSKKKNETNDAKAEEESATKEEEESKEDVNILIEIVSATELSPPKPKAKPSPYVTIHYLSPPSSKTKPLHKTLRIKKTLNPIWTVKSKSLFLLSSLQKQDFERRKGLRFEIWRGKDEYCFGRVDVGVEIVLGGKGERMEFPLMKDGAEQGGILALRFRNATPKDILFMKGETTEFYQKIEHSPQPPSPSPPKDDKSKRVSRDLTTTQKKSAHALTFEDDRQYMPGLFTKRTRRGNGAEKEVKVQPYPDPENTSKTTWMTETSLKQTSLNPSKKWLECGEGHLGKIYLEILGCDGLPNLDAGSIGDKSDPFVAIVFEDTLVRTDVIYDTLSPRWMPWSQRAFCFNIQHPTSILLLGVFDYDGPPYTDHDAVGRFVINYQNLVRDTVYVLRYALYADTNQEQQCGTATVRLRISLNNEKEAIQKSFTPAPKFLINVKTKKSLKVLRYLCKGQVNMEKTHLKTISLHASEFFSYFYAFCFAIDVMVGIVLWRGVIIWSFPKPDWILTTATQDDDETKSLTGSSESNNNVEEREMIKCNIWFPLHSILLFYAGTSITENPALIPSAFFFMISWVLFVIGYYQSYDPSPWHRCTSFYRITSILLLGQCVHSPIYIDPHDGEGRSAKLKAFNEARTKRVAFFLGALKTILLRMKREYAKTDPEGMAHVVSVAFSTSIFLCFYYVLTFQNAFFCCH